MAGGRGSEDKMKQRIFFSALHYKVKLKEVGLTEGLMLMTGAHPDLRLCALLVPASTFSSCAPLFRRFHYTVTVPISEEEGIKDNFSHSLIA